MGGCCTLKGLALWAVGAGSKDCLLGLLKVGGEGTVNGDTEGGVNVFEEACAEGGDTETATGRDGTDRGGVMFFDRGRVVKFKSQSGKEADPLLIVSGAQENLPTVSDGVTRSTDGLGHLEDLWSRTVLTEVSEGVVVVVSMWRTFT